MIEGWEIAVSSMKKEELSRFIVAPDYAYGALGCPPRIPKDATSKRDKMVGFLLAVAKELTTCVNPLPAVRETAKRSRNHELKYNV